MPALPSGRWSRRHAELIRRSLWSAQSLNYLDTRTAHFQLFGFGIARAPECQMSGVIQVVANADMIRRELIAVDGGGPLGRCYLPFRELLGGTMPSIRM